MCLTKYKILICLIDTVPVVCALLNIKYALCISQVILGRATNDVHVDIDLGKEGQVATRISRRQVRFLRRFGCKIHVHG